MSSQCESFAGAFTSLPVRIWATQGNIDAGKEKKKETRKAKKAREMGEKSMKLQKIASKAIHDTSAGYTEHTHTHILIHLYMHQNFPVYLWNYAQAHGLSYALQYPHLLRQIKVDLFYLHFDVVVAADFLLFLSVASV